MAKVLISDKLDPLAVEIFEKNGIEVDFKPGLSPEEQLAIIDQYDGLAVRSATTATPELIRAGKKLKVIGRAGIGVDNIDIPTATENGVVVMNTPFGNSITTAEHAIAMMFALARQIPQANESTHAGKWEKKKFMGVELTAKTKPLVVSMGSYAASAGYYISAPGNRIFANPATITGSIGVFYGKADVAQLLNKIGVNV